MNSLLFLTIKIARLPPKPFLRGFHYILLGHTLSSHCVRTAFSFCADNLLAHRGLRVKKTMSHFNYISTQNGTLLFFPVSQIPRGNSRMVFEHGQKLIQLFYLVRPFDSVLGEGCLRVNTCPRTF